MTIPDELLSLHFRLSDFVRSQTADRKGIDNTPPQDIIERLRANAAGLEVIREELRDNPIHISSGYRCLALNRAIGSKDNSAHVRGDAADIECPGFGSPRDICYRLAASDVQFDQIILEFDSWAHIGWPREGEAPRRQVLTIDQAGTRIGLPE